jgi:hypothetical protein
VFVVYSVTVLVAHIVKHQTVGWSMKENDESISVLSGKEYV